MPMDMSALERAVDARIVAKINEIIEFCNAPRCVSCGNLTEWNRNMFNEISNVCISCENKEREEWENTD